MPATHLISIGRGEPRPIELTSSEDVLAKAVITQAHPRGDLPTISQCGGGCARSDVLSKFEPWSLDVDKMLAAFFGTAVHSLLSHEAKLYPDVWHSEITLHAPHPEVDGWWISGTPDLYGVQNGQLIEFKTAKEEGIPDKAKPWHKNQVFSQAWLIANATYAGRGYPVAVEHNHLGRPCRWEPNLGKWQPAAPYKANIETGWVQYISRTEASPLLPVTRYRQFPDLAWIWETIVRPAINGRMEGYLYYPEWVPEVPKGLGLNEETGEPLPWAAFCNYCPTEIRRKCLEYTREGR